MSAGKWNRVSKNHLCPICHKDHNCTVLDNQDGTRLVYCGRVTENAIKVNQGGQGLHLIDHSGRVLQAEERSRDRSSQHPETIAPKNPFEDLVDQAIAELTRDRKLSSVIGRMTSEASFLDGASKKMGVSVESLQAIGAGVDRIDVLLVPEKNADHEIIGISTRHIRTGMKRFISGGNRGLTFAEKWPESDWDPILIVEGASDVAAAIDLGFSAIGRPSCDAGADEISNLIAMSHQSHRQIIVVAERDEKPDGSHPGLTGAIKVAEKLQEQLPQAVVDAALVPSGFKDLRDYRVSVLADQINSEQAARHFLGSLEIVDIKVKPRKHEPTCSCGSCRSEIEREIVESRKEKVCNFRRAVTDKKNILIIKVDCMSWCCPTCREKLQMQWSKHFRDTLVRSKLPDEWVYHHQVYSPKERAASLKAVNRRKGDAFTVRLSENHWLIVASVRPKGWKQMTPRAAAEYLSRTVVNSNVLQRRVTTTKQWRLPKSKPKKTNWREVKGNWTSSAAIKKAARIHRLDFRVPDWGKGEVELEIDVPLCWNDENFEGFSWTVRTIMEGRYDEIQAMMINPMWRSLPVCPSYPNVEEEPIEYGGQTLRAHTRSPDQLLLNLIL